MPARVADQVDRRVGREQIAQLGARQVRVRDQRRRERVARARRRDHEHVELVGDVGVARAEQRAVVGHRMEQILGGLRPLGAAQAIEADERA